MGCGDASRFFTRALPREIIKPDNKSSWPNMLCCFGPASSLGSGPDESPEPAVSIICSPPTNILIVIGRCPLQRLPKPDIAAQPSPPARLVDASNHEIEPILEPTRRSGSSRGAASLLLLASASAAPHRNQPPTLGDCVASDCPTMLTLLPLEIGGGPTLYQNALSTRRVFSVLTTRSASCRPHAAQIRTIRTAGGTPQGGLGPPGLNLLFMCRSYYGDLNPFTTSQAVTSLADGGEVAASTMEVLSLLFQVSVVRDPSEGV